MLARAILAALLLPAVALAQTEVPFVAVPSRDALIANAQRAADRGAHQEALELALEAARIEESPSLTLFIAQQQGLTGRTAEAIESARRCTAEAERDVALRNRRVIRATCRGLERELLRRVGLVTVSVAAPREDLAITINGAALPRDRWGRATVVEPGDVLVQASAGAASMRQRLRVRAGEESSIELHFESGELVSREMRLAPAEAAEVEGEGIEPIWIALPLGAAAAFGLVAIATGATVLDRGATYSTLYDRCAAADNAACLGARSVRSEGEALRDATNVMITAAAVSVAAGLVLMLFADLDEEGGAWPIVRF